MASKEEFYFPSSDGAHQIHAVRWLPEGEPRAVVQLVHGISEYIGRYDGFASFLAGRGFAVVGHDHLGHGGTAKDPSEYGFLAPKNGWRYLVEDVHTLRTQTGARFPGLPYILMGHSMGSFVTRTYLIDHPGTLDGCILSGTGQEPAALIALGKAVTGFLGAVSGKNRVSKLVKALTTDPYNKQFAPNRTSADWISRDTAVVDAYCADPLCAFSPTIGMNHDMMGGLQYVANMENLKKMDRKTPVYFLSGDADPVGQRGKGVRQVAGWFRDVGCGDITVKLYPEGRHEMLNEVNRDEVFADTLAWIEAHVTAKTAAAR